MGETVSAFLTRTEPTLDVRSPSEFLQGHIPGAHSFPLFSDEERSRVGTLYKNQGKEAAVKLGLECVGPKLSSFVEKADALASSVKSVRIYCWRGGMRSSSLAWLLETAGMRCMLLEGGYKSFRRWSLEQFKIKYAFILVGGFTGSGKTELLQLLKQQNEQVIDLEQLAQHRGSSFGHLGNLPQPSSEHFENLLAVQLAQYDPQRPIWIEDESRMIGCCSVPRDLWEQLGCAPVVWLQHPKEQRVKRLLEIYGGYPPNEIIQAVERLTKRLGTARTKELVQLIQEQKMEPAIQRILEYYDQAYTYACQKRPRKYIPFNCPSINPESAHALLSLSY
jgi:tRNA 2-selenouridine synthase